MINELSIVVGDKCIIARDIQGLLAGERFWSDCEPNVCPDNRAYHTYLMINMDGADVPAKPIIICNTRDHCTLIQLECMKVHSFLEHVTLDAGFAHWYDSGWAEKFSKFYTFKA